MSQSTLLQMNNVPGAQFRSELNTLLGAFNTDFSGAVAPTITSPYMTWLDTSVTPAVLKRRNAADTAWELTGGDSLKADLANTTDPAKGAALVGFNDINASAVSSTVRKELLDLPSTPKRSGAVGDGILDDTTKIAGSFTDLSQRGDWKLTRGTAYKITDTINVTGKAGAVINFNNQQINSSSFATPKSAIVFKGNSESKIDGIYVIGSVANTTEGALFSADVSNITIHAVIGKVRAANCQVGIQFGVDTHQMSDSSVDDIYGSDCSTGIKLTGENTLAMRYGRVAAFNNTARGVHIEAGGGSIESLQSAASVSDIYFGRTDGTQHSKLARWDILSGYSEEGVNGEVFIDSAACTDTSPFKEQIVINGFRCTPFSTTNVVDFIKWRLNGDLIINNSSFNHGQQEPRIFVDHNTTYRAPKVILNDCVIDCSPTTGPQVPMTYKLTDNRQVVEINARVNNGMTWWQNDGSANEGTIKSGIYMEKIKTFKSALMNVANLKGAWSLEDATSGSCKDLILGGVSLTASASLERRDFWLDDGLVGFFRNGTTSKTISTSSANYTAAAAYTFGCILRTTINSVDDTDFTALGGATGIRLGIGNSGGNFAVCRVGAVQAAVTPTNALDPHLLIGRYVSSTSVSIDIINLRTGEILNSTNTTSIPAFGSLTWSNGVSIRNDLSVRGFPFVYSRAISDSEVKQLQQAALQLTDSWRQDGKRSDF